MKRKPTQLLCMTPLFFSCISFAAKNNNDLEINGFLTAGAGALSTDKISVSTYDEHVSFKPDSVFGLQFTKHTDTQFSLTGQLLAKGADDFNVIGSWAYASYKATPDTTYFVGRFRSPLFYFSDFLDVGYAYNWVRLPIEVYAEYYTPFAAVDGVDVKHLFTLGQATAAVQAYYGVRETPSQGATIKATDSVGMTFELSYSALSFRASALRSDVQFVLTGANKDGLDLIAQLIGTSADELTHLTPKFYEVAVSYDDGANQAIAELTQTVTGAVLLPDTIQGLVEYSRHVHDMTFHITYAATKADVAADSYATSLQTQGGVNAKQYSFISGVRYDTAPGVALKFDVTYTNQARFNTIKDAEGMLYSSSISMVF
jgi:hypothetical protein